MGYIVRGTASNGEVRVFAAITTDIVEKAREIHDLSPTATAALGRLMTAAAIMGTMSKGEEDTTTLSINGGGPAGNVVVVADAKGNVKGYVSNPHAELPLNEIGKMDVGGIIGTNGTFRVVRDLGFGEPYVGQVPIQTGEIGDDLAYYFTYSEQVPSAVALGVLVDAKVPVRSAGGLIIQMMPGANEFLADIIMYRLEEIPPVSKLIDEGKTAEDILNLLFDDMDLKIYEKQEITYKCNCTRERVSRALIAMGREELTMLKEEDKGIEVGCHFCTTQYQFNEEDIDELLKG